VRAKWGQITIVFGERYGVLYLTYCFYWWAVGGSNSRPTD